LEAFLFVIILLYLPDFCFFVRLERILRKLTEKVKVLGRENLSPFHSRDAKESTSAAGLSPTGGYHPKSPTHSALDEMNSLSVRGINPYLLS
jgi:hypothetical protein